MSVASSSGASAGVGNAVRALVGVLGELRATTSEHGPGCDSATSQVSNPVLKDLYGRWQMFFSFLQMPSVAT